MGETSQPEDEASPPAEEARPLADEASLPADKASMRANEASPFGPYSFTKLSPSFLLNVFSPCCCMPKKVEYHPYDVHGLLVHSR